MYCGSLPIIDIIQIIISVLNVVAFVFLTMMLWRATVECDMFCKKDLLGL
jgi:hypothetical protein